MGSWPATARARSANTPVHRIRFDLPASIRSAPEQFVTLPVTRHRVDHGWGCLEAVGFIDAIFHPGHHYKPTIFSAADLPSRRRVRPRPYINGLVDLFAKLAPALADDGGLWLSLGDSYVHGQLSLVPSRVALALQSDGWLLRSRIRLDKSWTNTLCRRSRDLFRGLEGTAHEYPC